MKRNKCKCKCKKKKLDQLSRDMEWSDSSQSNTRHHNSDRCITPRVGCLQVVPGRTKSSHQSPRATVSVLVGHLRNLHIRLQVDNMTVMSYISHKGGTHSQELSSRAVKIWTWCLHRGITLEFLPGVNNVVVDEMWRNFNDRTEWHLLPEMFAEIVQELDFRPSVDLFASWHPDPQAW